MLIASALARICALRPPIGGGRGVDKPFTMFRTAEPRRRPVKYNSEKLLSTTVRRTRRSWR
jgi:hypothetical protein